MGPYCRSWRTWRTSATTCCGLRRRLEGVVARPTLLGPEAGKPDLPVPAQPEVELTTGDPEKAARLTDVPGDLAAEAKRLQIQSVGVSDPMSWTGLLRR